MTRGSSAWIDFNPLSKRRREGNKGEGEYRCGGGGSVGMRGGGAPSM
jgi:hypothetical protein